MSSQRDDGSVFKVNGDTILFNGAGHQQGTAFKYKRSWFLMRGEDHFSTDWGASGDLDITFFGMGEQGTDRVLQFAPSEESIHQANGSKPDMALYGSTLSMGDHTFSLEGTRPARMNRGYRDRGQSTIQEGSIGLTFVNHDGDRMEYTEVYKLDDPQGFNEVALTMLRYMRGLPGPIEDESEWEESEP